MKLKVDHLIIIVHIREFSVFFSQKFFPPMLAETKKFVSLVESGPPWCEHDVICLCKTQAAHLGGWVVRGGPGDDVPVNVMLDILLLESAHMA